MASRFLAGALLGMAAGLLLAPDKGENTRQNLTDMAGRVKNKLGRGNSGRDLDDLRAYLQHNINGLSSDVKHRILTIIDEATDMAYSPKSTVGNGVV